MLDCNKIIVFEDLNFQVQRKKFTLNIYQLLLSYVHVNHNLTERVKFKISHTNY